MKIKRFIGGNLRSNGYVISKFKEGNCYIIDPGYEAKKYLEYLKEQNLKLKGIILTHHHNDHVGAASKIRDALRAPILMQEKDAYVYGNEVDIYLHDGDKIDFDDEQLVIFETPGHTEGSICILSEKSKVVFTGDTIFDTDLGRTDLFDGSPLDMIDSCRNVINTWSNEYTIYPGHDGSATMKQVRKYNREFLDCLEAK